MPPILSGGEATENLFDVSSVKRCRVALKCFSNETKIDFRRLIIILNLRLLLFIRNCDDSVVLAF